jgi:DNA invertase Pin-like site-specific DNA recombinase
MTKGKRIGYVRVSTIDQNPERQLEGVELDKKFIDYASGSSMNRPQLESLLEYVRDDDIVIVHSLDRLARSLKDLNKIVDELISRKVSIQFVKEKLIFNGDSSPMSNLLFSMLGAFAQFERDLIRERLLEGVAIAKKAGKYKGRKSKLTKEKEEKIKEYIQAVKPKSKNEMARDLGVSRFSLYNYMKKIQQQQ